VERLMIPPVARKMYAQELHNLAEVVRSTASSRAAALS
jgi:hypothetical protein